MAYLSRNLSVLAYANGFTMWHYTIVDPAVTVSAPKYFEKIAEMLRSGDIILGNVDTRSAPGACFIRISGISNGAISNGAISNGAISNGAISNGAISNGAMAVADVMAGAVR